MQKWQQHATTMDDSDKKTNWQSNLIIKQRLINSHLAHHQRVCFSIAPFAHHPSSFLRHVTFMTWFLHLWFSFSFPSLEAAGRMSWNYKSNTVRTWNSLASPQLHKHHKLPGIRVQLLRSVWRVASDDSYAFGLITQQNVGDAYHPTYTRFHVCSI